MPRTIIVGYDDSPLSVLALERAIIETSPDDNIIVLTVAEEPLDLVEPRARGVFAESEEVPPLPPEPPHVTEALANARTVLARAGREGALEWAYGDAAGAILDVARQTQADIIVVGEHHHSRLARMFGEDPAAEIKRSAGCEVIVVHE
jgi:nucleotide-binding universal stress UspA family protein